MYHWVSKIHQKLIHNGLFSELSWSEMKLMWHINSIRTESSSSNIKPIPNIYFHPKMVPENMNELSSRNSSKWITHQILMLSVSHEQVIEKFVIIRNEYGKKIDRVCSCKCVRRFYRLQKWIDVERHRSDNQFI